MYGMVFIWATATRPDASCPLPSPLVSLNQGRCAGALAWVRTHTWCLAASTLIDSIIWRALLESGACLFVAAAAAVMTFSPESCLDLASRRARSSLKLGNDWLAGAR